MAARYATDTFVIQLASGASHRVLIGSLRDSTHGACVGAPALFSAVPQAGLHPRLQAYLNAYPAAEVT